MDSQSQLLNPLYRVYTLEFDWFMLPRSASAADPVHVFASWLIKLPQSSVELPNILGYSSMWEKWRMSLSSSILKAEALIIHCCGNKLSSKAIYSAW